MSEIVKAAGIRDEDALAEIGSFEDAIKAVEAIGGALLDTADLGTGFNVVEKETLVGVPFVIVDMRVNEKGTYGEFVTVHLVTEDNRKCIVNDGSTGLAAQVSKLVNSGRTGGVIVRKGLTRSDYDYIDEKGNSIPATTFYLS